MMDKTYSTATVYGMTTIPIRTIQDYVKDFRDCFSEAARQPSKGRRFNDLDIKRLLTIKRLRSERFTDDEIRKVFSGEIPLPLVNEYNDNDTKQMAVNAIQNMQIAIKLTQDCEAMLAENQKAMAQMRSENERLRNDFSAVKSRVERMREWQIFVMQTDPTLNPYEDKFPEQEPAEKTEKKPSLFEVFKETLKGS